MRFASFALLAVSFLLLFGCAGKPEPKASVGPAVPSQPSVGANASSPPLEAAAAITEDDIGNITDISEEELIELPLDDSLS